LHNHASCIIETPKHELLVTWYRGSGERSADDVAIIGSRKSGNGNWSDVFEMAKTPGFPDMNPCLTVDPNRKLWLIWPIVLDNHWESALLKVKTAKKYEGGNSAPQWDMSEDIHLKPGSEFQSDVLKYLRQRWAKYRVGATEANTSRLDQYLTDREGAYNTPLRVRLGWMPRVHPFWLGNRIILPLYSDGFDFSLMGISDDMGKTWHTSHPIVGAGNIQPSIVQKKDGTLVAYFRDNGPPPKRVMVSKSTDRGETWSEPLDTEIPNPGSGVEAIKLSSGLWVYVGNDTERSRESLTVYVSTNEGESWQLKRHLEHDAPSSVAGSYSYPSIIQSHDGTIHVSYSYRPQLTSDNKSPGESIKHAWFTEKWLLAGQ
ncbi:MAG: sialidase family protein, partial [Chthonomonadales bacterium]